MLEATTNKEECNYEAFAFEEPTRIGTGCLGSRALAGKLSGTSLKELRDKEGLTLYEAMKNSGYDPEKLEEVRITKDQVGMFIEMHIEQGPILDSTNKTIGLVDIIVAPTEILLTLKGEQRHAGSTQKNGQKNQKQGIPYTLLVKLKLYQALAT